MTFPGSIGSRRYCFDRDSNRVGYTAAAATGCSTLASSYTYATSAADRLSGVTQGSTTTAYSYDADGNTTGRGNDTLSWDRYGRLASATTSTGSGPPPVTDDFNRADSASLGSAWSAGSINPSVTCWPRIVANQAASPAASTGWCDRYHLTAAPADGVVFAKIAATQDANGYEISVRGRITDAGSAGFDTYQATYVERGSANDEYRLWKAVNGVFTLLASTTTGPNMQAGDQLGLKTQGTTISLWHKPAAGTWTQLLTATDSSISSGGQTGIQLRGPNGRLDDLTAATDFTTTTSSTVTYTFDPVGFRSSRTSNGVTSKYLLG